MKLTRIAGVSLALGLASCGGGGDNAPPPLSGGPTPSPTPTPTPTPASYTPLPSLTGDWSIDETVCWRDVDPELGILGFGQAIPETITISYSEDREEFRLQGDSVDITFGPSDNRSIRDDGSQGYSKFVTGGFTDVFNVTLFPVDSSDTVRAQYFGYFSLNVNSLAGPKRRYGCQFGMPTQPGDFTASAQDFEQYAIFGTGSRSGPGTGAGAYFLMDSTIDFRFDPARNEIDITLDIAAQKQPGSETELGEYTGTVPVDPATGRFEGSLPGSLVLSAQSEFSGYLYGPRNSEAVVTFVSTGNQSSSTTFRVYGQAFLVAD